MSRPRAEFGVVAGYGMGMQRQMPGKQIGLMRDEQRHARAALFPAPPFRAGALKRVNAQ